MADCSPTSIYVGDQILEVVALLRQEILRRGGQLTGGADSGGISIRTPVGPIDGKWRIAGRSLAIEITKRPAAVSCGHIEGKLQDGILDAKAVLRNQRKKDG